MIPHLFHNGIFSLLESNAAEKDLGVLVSGKLSRALAARRANSVLGDIRDSITAGQGRGLCCSALSWGSLTSSAGAALGAII